MMRTGENVDKQTNLKRNMTAGTFWTFEGMNYVHVDINKNKRNLLILILKLGIHKNMHQHLGGGLVWADLDLATEKYDGLHTPWGM